MYLENVLSETPLKLPYKRYRNKEHGYIVKVLAVQHGLGKHGFYSTVKVCGTLVSLRATAVWPIGIFLLEFEPVGKRLKIKSLWKRLV